MPGRHHHHHRHHRKPVPGTSALRVRFWLEGNLVGEVWIDSADSDAERLATFAGMYHTQLAELASTMGVPWLTEVYDPSAPEDEAYLRIGTDKAAMVDPEPLPLPEGWPDGWPGR